MDEQQNPATSINSVLTVVEAARELRIGRGTAYAMARRWRETNGREGPAGDQVRPHPPSPACGPRPPPAQGRRASRPEWHDLIFTWPDGRLIRPDTLTSIIGRMSTAAGLPRLTPHGLRHSFATAALKARIRVELVAARLGNTPRVVQEVYTHVIQNDDAAAAQLVGDLYRTPQEPDNRRKIVARDADEDDTEQHETAAS